MNYKKLQGTLSSPRLDKYLQLANGDEEKAVNIYLMNIHISEAFYFPIQTVEILLRNLTSDLLKSRYGPEWPYDESFYITFPNDIGIEILNKRESIERKINAIKHKGEIKDELKSRKDGGFEARRLPLPNRFKRANTNKIIVELNFYFWERFLNSRAGKELWEPSFKECFPHIDDSTNITFLHGHIKKIRLFRNRIAHHELICSDGKKICLETVEKKYKDISDFIYWVCGDTHRWVRQNAKVISIIRDNNLLI